MTAFTWLNYALFMKDVFLHANMIPALVVGVAVTLQWHPYLRKRDRRNHETVLIVGLSLISMVTLGTSTSININPMVSRIALGILAGLFTLVQVIIMARDVFRETISVDYQPPLVLGIHAIAALIYGGVWTAFGWFGSSDPVIYIGFAFVSVF